MRDWCGEAIKLFTESLEFSGGFEAEAAAAEAFPQPENLSEVGSILFLECL
jgi:hypothetical protein